MPDREIAWTDERVDVLKAKFADGLSASQIAGVLGGVTRNAVIGKLNRLGMHRGGWSPTTRPPSDRQRAGSRNSSERARTGISRAPAPPPRSRSLDGSLDPLVIETPVEDFAIPAEQRRTVLTIGEGECRWPVNEPGADDFFFCGGATTTRRVSVEGEWRQIPHPYCAHHHERSVDRGGMRASLLRAEQGQQNLHQQRRAFGA